MVNILIVDDNIERIREISSTIEGESTTVDYATTKNEALNKFENTRYDISIIDIMLPDNLTSIHPNKRGGIELIEDLKKRIKVNPPLNIIGITSHDDAFKENQKYFDDQLIPILVWQAGDESWKEKILQKIKYLNTLTSKNNSPSSVDIAIITAVEDEFLAVQNCFENWEKIKTPNDPDTYFHTTIKTKKGDTRNILSVMLPQMGLTAASNTTTKLILKFAPSSIIMVGICGGIRGSVKLGDIIIASNSWDYGCGKIKPKEQNIDSIGYYTFEAAPNQIAVHPNIIDCLKYSTEEVVKKISQRWSEIDRDKPLYPQIHIGPMPSGASVICDETLFHEIIKPQHRKCLGLDMETYGVYYSSQHTQNTNINFLSFKSVSDYADKEKNDEYHDACCYFSANLLKEYIINDIL